MPGVRRPAVGRIVLVLRGGLTVDRGSDSSSGARGARDRRPCAENSYPPAVISFEPIGQIALIRLDRPEKRNSLTVKMLAALRQALDNAVSAHAVVLSGVGGVFCAGFDLTACRDDPTVLPGLLKGLWSAARALREHPAPVVISAHGAAIAGGSALVAAADIAVTNATAKLGYPVVRLGISPAVSAPLLRLAIGDASSRERMLDPSTIDGPEALRVGLVHECLPTAGDCEPRAIEIARQLAAKPRHGVAYTKRWLNEIDGSLDSVTLDAGLNVSLGIVGSAEQDALLPQAWSARPGRA